MSYSPVFTCATNHQQRIGVLRKRLDSSPYDAMIVSSVQNCRYLSGFANTDPNVAFLIISQKALYLVTDYRYSEQATAQCADFTVIERDRASVSLGLQLSHLLRDCNAHHVAYERDHMSVGMLQGIEAELSCIKSGAIKADGIAGWVEQQRMVKDASEIANIKAAAAISDRALAHLTSILKAGISERDAALDLEYHMQKLGSEGLSFPTILISGERSSLPHGMPGEKKLAQGDLITIDFGAVVNGYRSDMTRAFVVGEPSEKQLAVYDTVKMAQQAGLQSVMAGVKGDLPYAASREVLDASPFAKFQGEGLGHGVGLFLHEQPFLQSGCDIVLQENMVITIEPGIYIPGWGGVRIEDDILVTKTGFEMITHAPRALVVV